MITKFTFLSSDPCSSVFGCIKRFFIFLIIYTKFTIVDSSVDPSKKLNILLLISDLKKL